MPVHGHSPLVFCFLGLAILAVRRCLHMFCTLIINNLTCSSLCICVALWSGGRGEDVSTAAPPPGQAQTYSYSYLHQPADAALLLYPSLGVRPNKNKISWSHLYCLN